MNLSESNRVSEGLDIWVIEGFAQEKLNCDPAKLQEAGQPARFQA